MEKEKYLEDIAQIRSIMEKSTKFISLSGLSGIMAGITGLLGAAAAFYVINSGELKEEKLKYGLFQYQVNTKLLIILSLLGVIIFLVAAFLAYYFTDRKAKKEGQKVWTPISKKLLLDVMIPMITGGIVCVIMVHYGFVGLVAPFTLIFYGLACIMGSYYTISDIKYLGLTEIILGLFNLMFIGYGLIFWAIGFGLMHIIYGYAMYIRYDVN